MSTQTIRISEIFGPTIQGEGVLIGQPTVFVRTGGCDYRCTWCDTMHAVDPQYRQDWIPMHAEEIFAQIVQLSGGKPLMISLSGGNPAIQPLAPLITLGREHGYRFALETQGSYAQNWFAQLDVLTLSPKPPSSGMETDWDSLHACIDAAEHTPETVLKIPVLDEADYAYARDCAKRYPSLPMYLQPVNPIPPDDQANFPVDIEDMMTQMRWLVERINQDQWYDVRILPQLHVLLWGNKRGV